MFDLNTNLKLAKGILLKTNPIYVQFYITARCNLTCQQCNIIYANADMEECDLDKIKMIAQNLSKLGVSFVLLTGGEPYMRKDLPEIIKIFTENDIHVRMQTNGFANEEKIHESIENGGRDISISLDSLKPLIQDKINGGFKNTWQKALESVCLYTKYLPKEGSFASFGCVLQPDNVYEIKKIIKFSTKIDWYTSLVPIHTTSLDKPMGFRTFDKFIYSDDQKTEIKNLVKQIEYLKKEKNLIYDSKQYLEDIVRFSLGEPITWRKKNKNVCDSPKLYFAILPNGTFAPCCDHRIQSRINVFDSDFPKVYKSKRFKEEVYDKVSGCTGCMYGSYPEITISSRFFAAQIQRFNTFFLNNKKNSWPLNIDKVLELARSIDLNN